jgi:hypothetical protein
MPKRKKQPAPRKPSRPRPGIIAGPAAEDLKLTEQEVYLLDTLNEWHDKSAKSAAVLARPVGCKYSLE